ncbi:MAG: hypothetical protein JNK45_35235 [Myxococcales bacterium]|nr:hypothetical protein [Myxococcales bacterium]
MNHRHHRTLVVLSLSVPVACVVATPPGDDPSAGSGESGISITDGITGNTEGSLSASGASAASASDTGGPVFDVGVETADGSAGDTMPTNGSCRSSEAFGAAGGFPAYTDPAYASFLDRQVLAMTSYAYLGDEAELRIFDISGAPPPPNLEYAAPMYIHPSWNGSTFGGGIFGLTIDSYGNIYVAASTVYGVNSKPDSIFKIDKDTAEVSTFATLPNAGPAFGNLNYDCDSETLRVVNHEDCRIYQLDMAGGVVSTYHHGTGDVTLGQSADPGEPDGVFCPLGDRMWAVQAHYGRVYYSVWWEDGGRPDDAHSNEIWSVEVDGEGIPDGATKQLEATIPGLQGSTMSNPVSDLSFASTGWMLVSERTMYADNATSAHQSTTYELQQMNGTWDNIGTTYVVGDPVISNSAAGGVDHDFAENGYVWMTGDALDFGSPNIVYGVQGTPYGGGTVDISTIIDHDGEITQQDKTAMGDCEIPIPGDAMPPPPPPQG